MSLPSGRLAKIKSPKYVACNIIVEYNGPFDLHFGEHVDEKDITDIIRTGRTNDLIYDLKNEKRDAEQIKEIIQAKEKFDATCKEMADIEKVLAPVWNSQRDFGAEANKHWFCPILFAVKKDKYLSSREFVGACSSIDYIRLVKNGHHRLEKRKAGKNKNKPK